jgi:hypothetical protein
LKDTALYRVPIWVYNLTAGRFLHKANENSKHDETSSDEEDEPAAEADDGDGTDGVEDFEILDKVRTTAPNGVITGKAVKRNKKSAKGR